MILRDVPGEIRALITGPDGAKVAGSPVVTVTIVRDSDGSTVVDGLAATEPVAGSGIYKYTVPAVDDVDLLRASWAVAASGGTFRTEHEVVGGFMCSLEAVSEDIDTPPAADTLRAARFIAETWLEKECSVAFRPRYAREEHIGSDSAFLRRPRPTRLIAATVDGTAVDVADLTLSREGWVTGLGASSDQTVEIIYVHGWERTPGAGVRAAARLGRFIVVKRPSNFDERATTYSTDEASYTLVTPGVRGAVFSLPEVNSFVEGHSYVEGIA